MAVVPALLHHANACPCTMLQELRQIMALHGGTFVVNYARSAVTHIICSHLTDRKVQLFKKMRWVIGMQQLMCSGVWHGTPLSSLEWGERGTKCCSKLSAWDVSC